MSKQADELVFKDDTLARRYRSRPIPMSELCEAYFAGRLEFRHGVQQFLARRRELVSFRLTGAHVKWAVSRYLPRRLFPSTAKELTEVQGQYDRGDDFFEWFLGERMTYTTAYFESPDASLEQAQDASIEHVLNKLALRPGDRVLDIGCGWGTLVMRAAARAGVDVTGVTISQNQVRFACERIAAAGLSRSCRVLCQDYRDIPRQRFDKIVCLEMVEHVGIRNLRGFYDKVRDLLDDRGLFLLQWTGQKRQLVAEDLIFGLFMEMHVAPGADAGLCPSAMLRVIEDAGLGLDGMENMSSHYAITIRHWSVNWVRNREHVTAQYGERAFRVWQLFLAWGSVLLEQGGAACYQALLRGAAGRSRLGHLAGAFSLLGGAPQARGRA